MTSGKFHTFYDLIGYSFKSDHLLTLAMTHPSYAHEHGHPRGMDYQRLEFLGDAILELNIREQLYTTFPALDEGELSRIRSRLVCAETLSKLATQLNFQNYLRVGASEHTSAGTCRKNILADAYEAVIAAIYLDGGMAPAKAFILRYHQPLIDDPDGGWLEKDAKSLLYHWTQANKTLLSFNMLGTSGPDHAPTYEFAALIDGNVVGSGFGHSKKDAQQAASRDAIQKLGLSLTS